jgi:hypothetical protein
MSAVIAWLMANWMLIASALLGISEALHVIFPSSDGFGGFVNAVIQFLKGIGAKDPGQS